MQLVPLSAKAQWSFDIGTVEAYINDHKQQRSLLLARSTLEHSNKLLHEYSRKETVGYKELNVDLDKYTRAFDVIDVMYQSLRTALNVHSTYQGVSDRISDYKAMLEDFNEKVIKRNADTLHQCQSHTDDSPGRRIPLQVRERFGIVRHRSGSLFHFGLADGVEQHQLFFRHYRKASEQGLLRDMAVHTSPYRLLERESLSHEKQTGTYRRCFRQVETIRKTGLLTTKKQRNI